MGTGFSNEEVAAVFHEMADLLHIQGGNPYRIRAFSRAAAVIENLPEPASVMLRFGTLEQRPGIGEGTLHRVKQILRTGTCDDHRQLRGQLPPGLRDMLEVHGIGARTARLFWQQLRIGSVDELEVAARAGKLHSLPRMGEATVQRILRGIEAWRRRVGRVPFVDARKLGLRMVDGLSAAPEVQRIALLGSIRRGKATIGDLDILVAAEDRAAVVSRFVALPAVEAVLARGEGRCQVRLQNRQQCDLRVVEPECFGAGMHYFTGNNLHNIHLRARGNRFQLKISDKGVFRRSDELRLLPGTHEEEIFAAVGLPFIAPELRENLGEIEAAAQGRLPVLVEARDLRGDLHLHTTNSDGSGTAEEMVAAARALGHEYLAVTDHTKSCEIAHGQDARQLYAQMQALRELDARADGMRVLAGVEVDILLDGSLDIDVELLSQLDWVIGSVHSHFDLPSDQMTVRLIRAMETGVVDCIGHPTNRRLGHRPGSELDLERLVAAARRLDVALEVNGNPHRMDLPDKACRIAKEMGVPLCINTDSHAPGHLAYQEYGLMTARRGWVEAKDVLNCRPWESIAARRRDRMRRGSTQVAVSAATLAIPPPAPLPSETTPADPTLGEALARTPLPRDLVDRLGRFLQGEPDPALAAALSVRNANPVQAAFDLICSQPPVEGPTDAPVEGTTDGDGTTDQASDEGSRS